MSRLTKPSLKRNRKTAMNDSTLPADTHPDLDLIRTAIPDGQPDWTENICFHVHDQETGICLYAHLGRMQPDRTIWEGLSLIYLPNGEVLVNRSLGVSLAEARNKEYHFRPVTPLQTWQYDFDGVAQRVNPEDLRTRPVADEPFEAVSYSLTFNAAHPVYNMHRSGRDAEHMHLEHGGWFEGEFLIEGKTIAVRAPGYRDHSVSRRTFTTLDTETWANCTFPGGRAFSMLQVSRGERHFQKGQIFRDGKLQVAQPLNVPELSDSKGTPGRGHIELEVDGEKIGIEYETISPHFLPFNLLRPVGMRPGMDLSNPENIVAVQCPTRYRWDGETGYGWLERSRAQKSLR